MKHLQLILQSVAACSVLLILALIILTSGLSSCASDPTERRLQISQTANLALAVAEFTGRITPKQSSAVRKAGVLLLDASEGKQPTLVQISNTAVDTALEWGAITQEQADQLHAAGTVPLEVPPVPETQPVHSPGPALPIVTK